MECLLQTQRGGNVTFAGVSVLFQVIAFTAVALVGAVYVDALLAAGAAVAFINICSHQEAVRITHSG